MSKTLVLAWGLTVLALPHVAVADEGDQWLIRRIDALKSDDRYARLRAAKELGDFGIAAKNAVPALTAALEHDIDREVRQAAGRSLGQIGAPGLRTLQKALKHQEAFVREHAARALGWNGPDAIVAVPALVGLLADKVLEVRLAAAEALGEIGADAQGAVPALLERIMDEAKVRTKAINALVKIGPAGVPVVGRALLDRRPRVRYWSAYVLGMIGPDARDAVAALGNTLADKDKGVRQMAAAALGSMGPTAAQAVPDLIRTLAEPAMHNQAIAALVSIGPASVGPALAVLKDDSAATRGAALVVVCRVGDDPKQAIQAALERLRFDTDAKVRYAAALLLGDIGKEEKAVIPALIDRLEDRDPGVRFMAAGVLGQIGAPAVDAVPALAKLAKDANPFVRVGSALAQEMIQPDKARAARIQNDLAILTGAPKPNDKEEMRRLSLFEEAIVQRAIEAVLLIDAANMTRPRGNQAEAALSTLGPEALPAFVTALLRYNVEKVTLAPVLATRVCADAFFGKTLNRLVHETGDVRMLGILLAKVPPPENLPVMSRDLNNTIQVILIQRIFELQQGAMQRIQREQVDLLLQERRKLEQQIAKERLEKLQARIELRRELQKSGPEFLKASLKDKEQDTRLVAVEIIGERRMQVEEELIGLLTDRDPDVRQAARLALQKIGRGTDFGPTLTAERGERLFAVRTWRRWLAIQKEPELARAGPLRQKDEKQSLQDAYLEGLDSEAALLAKQLVQAPGDKLTEVLTQLEESKDASNTVALKAAIPQLMEPGKKKAREALTDRLTLQDAAALKELFQDDDAEMRRAAALAYARKPGRTTIPDLIDLLDDSEPIVVQGAREALKDMTGQDYGPAPSASRSQRSLSRAAWYGWWLKQAPRSVQKNK